MDATAPLADARPRGGDLVLVHVVRALALLAMVAHLAAAALALVVPLAQGWIGVPAMVEARMPASQGIAVAPAQAWVETTVTVLDAPGWLAALVVGAAVVGVAGGLVVLAGVAWLAHRMLRGAPFAASARGALAAIAIGVMLVSLIAPALRGLASTSAMPLLGSGYGAVSSLDLAAMLLLLVILALMVAFRIGERMQRDVGGLV